MSCYCDYERPSFCHVEMRKARKEHKCFECDHVIAVGEIYEHVRGKWEGDIYTFDTCERCVDLRTAIGDYCGGCFQYGVLFEEYSEYLNHLNGFMDSAREKCNEILNKHRNWQRH